MSQNFDGQEALLICCELKPIVHNISCVCVFYHFHSNIRWKNFYLLSLLNKIFHATRINSTRLNGKISQTSIMDDFQAEISRLKKKYQAEIAELEMTVDNLNR